MTRDEWLEEMSADRTNIVDRRGFREARGETEFASGTKPYVHIYNWGVPDRTSYDAAQYHAEHAPDDPDAQKLAEDARFAKMVNELKKKRSIMVTR